jgi:hypothetical protein
MVIDKAIETRIREIEPGEARQLVGAFKSAGKVDQKLVKTYAEDMKAGRWMLTCRGLDVMVLAKRKKSARLSLRITSEEKDKVVRFAAAQGMTPSELLRKLLANVKCPSPSTASRTATP